MKQNYFKKEYFFLKYLSKKSAIYNTLQLFWGKCLEKKFPFCTYFYHIWVNKKSAFFLAWAWLKKCETNQTYKSLFLLKNIKKLSKYHDIQNNFRIFPGKKYGNSKYLNFLTKNFLDPNFIYLYSPSFPKTMAYYTHVGTWIGSKQSFCTQRINFLVHFIVKCWTIF